jgi:carbon-monoxide dehydrogenase small subunit
MIIPMTLNGKEVTPDVAPQKRLIELLREDFGLLKTRGECYHGVCGRCLVILNDRLAQACLIPVFAVKGQNILTIEGFEKSPEYKAILKGFNTAGYYPCDTCLTGRILATHVLLETLHTPTDGEIHKAMSYSHCACTNLSALTAGVREAGRIREGR